MTLNDACALLDDDHKKVERLFADYEAAGSDTTKKSQLAQAICMELTVHASLEEEIFYPPFRQATGDDDMVDEAEEEHQEARDLIAQIEGSHAPDDALVTELQEAVEHHVKEERDEMFPKARSTPALDLMDLRRRLEARKMELLTSYQAA
jgi:iron-sulfur cluster repair protein YtfE (RIC family)